MKGARNIYRCSLALGILSLTACSIAAITDGFQGQEQCGEEGWARSAYDSDLSPEYVQGYCIGECGTTLPACALYAGEHCVLADSEGTVGGCLPFDQPDAECSDLTNNQTPARANDNVYVFDARFSARSEENGFRFPEGTTCMWVTFSAFDERDALPGVEDSEALADALEVVTDPPSQMVDFFESDATYFDDATSSSVSWMVYFATVCFDADALPDSAGVQLFLADRSTNRVCARSIPELDMNARIARDDFGL